MGNYLTEKKAFCDLSLYFNPDDIVEAARYIYRELPPYFHPVGQNSLVNKLVNKTQNFPNNALSTLVWLL